MPPSQFLDSLFKYIFLCGFLPSLVEIYRTNSDSIINPADPLCPRPCLRFIQTVLLYLKSRYVKPVQPCLFIQTVGELTNRQFSNVYCKHLLTLLRRCDMIAMVVAMMRAQMAATNKVKKSDMAGDRDGDSGSVIDLSLDLLLQACVVDINMMQQLPLEQKVSNSSTHPVQINVDTCIYMHNPHSKCSVCIAYVHTSYSSKYIVPWNYHISCNDALLVLVTDQTFMIQLLCRQIASFSSTSYSRFLSAASKVSLIVIGITISSNTHV